MRGLGRCEVGVVWLPVDVTSCGLYFHHKAHSGEVG